MVYKLDAGTVIDAEGNLVIENLYAGSVSQFYQFQGSTSGYTSGGSSPTKQNTIDKFPVSSDANATDVGDLTVARDHIAGQSSLNSGYTSGGEAPPYSNVIDKFPFSSDASATDVGDLSQARANVAGQSSSSNGYTTGGFAPPTVNTIDKFPFSSDANATDVGDLVATRYNTAGNSENDVNGYATGGSTVQDSIYRFPFSSDGNATDVANISQARRELTGQSSDTHGYTSGGSTGPATPTGLNTIDKFSFANTVNGTDVGDLTQTRSRPAGQSSTASGYSSGGGNNTPPVSANQQNTIDKFPFATDANATDVGDLTQARDGAAGQQV
jgi:hypothetical protein